MTESSAAAEIKLREQNGDTKAAVMPYNRLRADHPFQVDPNLLISKSGEFNYFFPAGCLWSKSAKGFGQIVGKKITNSIRCYQNMIDHIWILSNVIGEGMEENKEKQFITWTVVPHKDKPDECAGYLVRILYQIGMDEVFQALDAHINSNNIQHEKALKKNQSPDNLPAYRKLTSAAYVEMCDWYLNKTGRRAHGFTRLSTQENPYNPLNVFSLKNAVNKMKNNNAAPSFCDIGNWCAHDENLPSFPEAGSRTYLLHAEQLNILQMRHTYLPHVSREEGTYETDEFIAFARNAGLNIDGADDVEMDVIRPMEDDDNDSEADGFGMTYAQKLEKIKKDFSYIASSTEADSANTLIDFKKKVEKRMLEAKNKAGEDPEKRAIYLREAKKECVKWFFRDIFTTDETADVGDAIPAIRKWFDDWLRTHKNFMMPNPKFSSNLSRWQDTLAQEAEMGDTIWGLLTSHQEVKSVRLSSMHVYFNTPFHVHANLLGPPSQWQIESPQRQ
jgi:hypothetical protein